tara:strand:+ start:105 stop:695 length:591 start_codon:yes stop_codon:yes gene_type:complete
MSTLTVNTINESTAANGVTVDGLSLKDGNVVPAAGKGIDFSAAADTASGETVVSSVLNDFETGTFSPNLNNTTGNMSTNAGTYTRIGNVVFCVITMHCTGVHTNVGSNVHLYCNIPHTTANVSHNRSLQALDYYAPSGTTATGLFGSIPPNSDSMHFYRITTNTNDLTSSAWRLMRDDIHSGNETLLIRGTFQYFV